MSEVTNVSHTHEAIMNFMIANPALPLSAVAAHFGYSQSWLSTLIHSHAFKSRLREKQDAAFGELAISLTERIEALSHRALEIVHDGLNASPNPVLALEVADKMLHRLGYAPVRAAGPNVSVQNVLVSPDVLAAARERITANVQSQEVFIEAGSQPALGGPDREPAICGAAACSGPEAAGG